MGSVTGRRATLALLASLDAAGFRLPERPAALGWAPRDGGPVRGTRIRPLAGRVVEWRVEGGAGQGGILVDVLRSLGTGDPRTEADGDDGWTAVTAHPRWLEDWDPTNFATPQPCDPMLGFFHLSGFPAPVPGALPVYCVDGGDRVAPAETVAAICEAVGGEERSDGGRRGSASLARNGTFSVLREGGPGVRGVDHEARRGMVANWWGDEVAVWRIPGRWLSATAHFSSSVPVLVEGRMVARPGFGTLDEQYGDSPRPTPPMAR